MDEAEIRLGLRPQPAAAEVHPEHQKVREGAERESALNSHDTDAATTSEDAQQSAPITSIPKSKCHIFFRVALNSMLTKR